MAEKPKLIFAEGCFDEFEGTQEELDELVADIKRMFESGELMENSERLSEEEWDEIMGDVEDDPDDDDPIPNRTRH